MCYQRVKHLYIYKDKKMTEPELREEMKKDGYSEKEIDKFIEGPYETVDLGSSFTMLNEWYYRRGEYGRK